MSPRDVWAIYFAGLVSIAMHPGHKGEMDLSLLATIADEMLNETTKRWGGYQCQPGSQPESEGRPQ